MPPPLVKWVHRKASWTIAEAATEIQNAEGDSENEVVNCGVSCDGTWQR